MPDTETRLTPPEQRMANGMSAIAAYLTEATCGEACWEAREDVCRCSCGGKNHGCMRTADGTRPTRNSKIDGYRYELKAVGPKLYAEAEAINKAAGPYKVDGRYTYTWSETMPGAPARLKPATKDQVARWPELAAARAEIDAIYANPRSCGIDLQRVWPYLLWVKVSADQTSQSA